MPPECHNSRTDPSAADQADFSRNPLLETILAQNCENARHIKNERLTFVNIYAIVVAGTLSLMSSIKGNTAEDLYLSFFLWFFTILGLISSLRLKAELDECMTKISAIAKEAGLADYLAAGMSEGRLTRLPKFRWVFPVFYLIASVGFFGLLMRRLWHFL